MVVSAVLFVGLVKFGLDIVGARRTRRGTDQWSAPDPTDRARAEDWQYHPPESS